MSTLWARGLFDGGGLMSGAEQLREALAELVDAVEMVGDRRRYWPRDMRLDGTGQRLELALDKALAVLGSSTPPVDD